MDSNRGLLGRCIRLIELDLQRTDRAFEIINDGFKDLIIDFRRLIIKECILCRRYQVAIVHDNSSTRERKWDLVSGWQRHVMRSHLVV